MSEAAIHATEIDGVPVFWGEGGDPSRLALMFRLGFGDEQLSWRGVSHLVEHLALSGLAHQTYSYNGFVDEVRTTFYAQGSSDQLVEYAQHVTAALSNLPVERISAERRVLQSEQQSQPPGSWASHMSLRYGARGYGLADYPQFGLRWLAADQVNLWSRDRFNKANAAAWISGRPPEAMRFSLPEGKKVPFFPVDSIALPTPCVAEHTTPGVGVSMVGPRGAALLVGARIVDRRLKERLRWQQGVAYAPGCVYRGLNDELAHLLLHSDSSEEDAEAVIEAMLDVIRELHLEGPTNAELDDDRSALRSERTPPLEAQLDLRCFSQLTGRPWKSLEEIHREQLEVTGAMVAQAIREAWSTAIVLTPPDQKARAAALNQYPMWSTHRIHGRSHSRRLMIPGGTPSGMLLVSSDQGVMLVSPNGRYVTEEFAATAAVLCGTNGNRVMIGNDGFAINLDPREWNGIDSLFRTIDAQVPGDRFVPSEKVATDVPDVKGCEVCGAVPAREVTLKRKTRWRREETLTARFCRDCGRAMGRGWQDFTLRRTLLGMMTIPAVIANSIALGQLTLLSAPQRKSGVDHWIPGRSVFLRVGFYVLAVPIALILVVAVVIAIGISSQQ